MEFKPVGVYPNPICPILSYLSSILLDRDLYRPGGVSCGVDTRRAEHEMIPKPHDTRCDEHRLGGIPAGLS